MILRNGNYVNQQPVADQSWKHGSDIEDPRWWEITCHDCGEVFESHYLPEDDDTCRQCDSGNISAEEI